MTTDANSGAAAGAGFRVTATDIRAASTATRQTAEEVQGDLTDLRRYVQDVEAMWQGVASNTFQLLMEDFDVYAAMLNQALTDIASGLEGNYVNYSATEEQQIKNLQAVNGTIPGANFS